jgi:hypothetical protein
MEWLVNVKLDADLEKLKALLAKHGAVRQGQPIPLGEDELALEVNGPDDLPKRLRRSSAVVGVFPNSKPELY